MKMARLLVAFAVGSVGVISVDCATSPLQQKYNRYVKLIEETHARARVPDDAPYISDEMLSDEYIRNFTTQLCGYGKIDAPDEDGRAFKATSQAINKCQKKWLHTFYARLKEKYYAGDAERVNTQCQAHPIECKDFKMFEEWAREAHNENVELSRVSKIEKLDAWKAELLDDSEIRDVVEIRRMRSSIRRMGYRGSYTRQPASEAPVTPERSDRGRGERERGRDTDELSLAE